jgi:predicted SprT family Zn-dependent metalloprotease
LKERKDPPDILSFSEDVVDVVSGKSNSAGYICQMCFTHILQKRRVAQKLQ